MCSSNFSSLVSRVENSLAGRKVRRLSRRAFATLFRSWRSKQKSIRLILSLRNWLVSSACLFLWKTFQCRHSTLTRRSDARRTRIYNFPVRIKPALCAEGWLRTDVVLCKFFGIQSLYSGHLINIYHDSSALPVTSCWDSAPASALAQKHHKSENLFLCPSNN